MIKRSETGNGRRKFLSCSLELVARSYTCEADHWASRIKVQAARLIHRTGLGVGIKDQFFVLIF